MENINYKLKIILVQVCLEVKIYLIGKKSIVLRTTNAFGGENSILATLYIVFGAISILISIGF